MDNLLHIFHEVQADIKYDKPCCDITVVAKRVT